MIIPAKKYTLDSLDTAFPEKKPGSHIRELLKSKFDTGHEIRRMFDEIDSILERLKIRHEDISTDSGRFHRQNLQRVWEYFQPHQYSAIGWYEN